MRARRALVAAVAKLFAAAALSACGTSSPSDACAKAVDRLTSDCKFSVESGSSGAELNCQGEAACNADCLYISPCEDIKNDGPTFRRCLDACKE